MHCHLQATRSCTRQPPQRYADLPHHAGFLHSFQCSVDTIAFFDAAIANLYKVTLLGHENKWEQNQLISHRVLSRGRLTAEENALRYRVKAVPNLGLKAGFRNMEHG